jgi:hypothetical protein
MRKLAPSRYFYCIPAAQPAAKHTEASIPNGGLRRNHSVVVTEPPSPIAYRRYFATLVYHWKNKTNKLNDLNAHLAVAFDHTSAEQAKA